MNANLILVPINCDLGERDVMDTPFTESDLMPFIDQCNIACGGHAGNAELMQLTIDAAQAHQVSIGAHPGYPDRKNFGRKHMSFRKNPFIEMLIQQLSTFDAVVQENGAEWHHIKPHGALYHDVASNRDLAIWFFRAIKTYGPQRAIIGPPYGHLRAIALQEGWKYLNEGFMDRRYLSSGELAPRTEPNAIIHNVDEASNQYYHLCKNGFSDEINFNTICVHGDHPNTLRILKKLKDEQSGN